MKKRILAVLLTLIMTICCIPFSAVSANVISSDASLPFYDVDPHQWYVSGIEACYINGIVAGTSDVTFSPNGELTREMFCRILAMVDKADLSSYTSSEFIDVKPGKWYTSAVAWAHANGYTSGIGEGYFGVGKTITREQISKMFQSYMQKNEYVVEVSNSLNFSDASQISSWALDGVKYAVSAGLMRGTTATTFSPKMNMDRAQASEIIKNFMNIYLYAECEHDFDEPTCTKSATCTLCGYKKGFPLGHNCPKLSCVAGSTCERCGEYIASDPKMHNYKPATCTAARTCTNCSKTFGSPLGHTTSNGICTRCNREVFKNKYDRVVYYLKKKGTTVDNDIVYSGLFDYGDGTQSVCGIVYDKAQNYLYFDYIYFFDETEAVEFRINMTSRAPAHSYTYQTMYYSGGTVLYSAAGKLTPDYVNPNMYFIFDNYWGDASVRYAFNELALSCLVDCVSQADYLLNDLAGESVTAFNFPKQ